jgi:biopolymer transport protein ExbB
MNFSSDFSAIFAPLLAAAPTPEPAALSPLAPGPDGVTTLWNVLLSGGIFMIPLAVLLFVGTLLVMVYFLTLRRGNVVTRRFLDTAEALLRKRDYLGLLAVSNRHGEAVAHVTQRALDFATRNPTAKLDTIREVAETEAVRQANMLNGRISYLADVGTIAPMVGLLGTVSGMIKSFSSLATDIATSKPMQLASGVSEALVCTASGLVIGIMAFAFFAYFRGRVGRLTADLESAATQMMALFAMYYSPGGAVGAIPRRREREPVALEDEF